jgi:class 3 adenylate cyclase
VRSLVLYGTAARFTQELPDFPWGMTPTALDGVKRSIDAHWGEGRWAKILLGDAADVPGVREMVGRWEHTGASPTMAALLVDAFASIDVRDVLKSVRTPTLVLSRPGDQMVPFEASAALAAGIPGAVFRPLPPGAHAAFDMDDSFVTEILGFVCERPSPPNERVLATVLFTDIVGSTELLSSQGDERWRRQLDVHDKLVDGLLSKYGGRREKHTGDGVFAIFDGPTKAARCGLELVPALATRGMRIRVGIHTGECERRGAEWSGMAVHVGARIGALAGANEVLTSRTVRDLSAGSLLNFESIGPQHLKGVPEDVDVYRVRAA